MKFGGGDRQIVRQQVVKRSVTSTDNRVVAGSSPARSSYGPVAQLVEHETVSSVPLAGVLSAIVAGKQ